MIKDWVIDSVNTVLPYSAESRVMAGLRRRIYLARLRRTDILTWRLEKARAEGMKIGDGCRLFSCNVYSEPYLVELGNNVIVSGLVKFITHDGGVFIKPGLVEDLLGHYGRISIGDNSFIGMDATIMPNVSIGANCIIGAGSVVYESVPDGFVIAGNPATVQFKTEMYLKMKQFSRNTITCREHTLSTIPVSTKRRLLETAVPEIPPTRLRNTGH